jgi:hypothetical protein
MMVCPVYRLRLGIKILQVCVTPQKETLPGDLQEKVKSEYDCCAGIDPDKKDNSTSMKHWFSNNHFRTAVGEEFFHLQPMFVCPSFIAMMLGCRSAKYVFYFLPSRGALACRGVFHFPFLRRISPQGREIRLR